MALFHFTVTQTKRSKGQSAIASAAYRSGEKLYSEYYGEYSDYTRKRGVICSDILLPPHAPKEYADRQTLWNAVEKAERGKNAQLAYSFEISLQNEFSLEENIALAREFLFREFVSRGMTVDVSFHEKECEDGGTPNPHFHFLCPIRPMEQDGTWGIKQRREYVLDEEGNRIRDANGKYVFNAVPTTDWGSPETLEHWREAWAEMCNAKFAEKGLDVRIDHRSYERQGVDLLPTIHEGATVRAMEKKGIRTEKGEFNRWIKATNLQQQEHLYGVVQRQRKRHTEGIYGYELPAAGTPRPVKGRNGRSRAGTENRADRRAAAGATPGYPYRADKREARREIERDYRPSGTGHNGTL